MDSSTLQRSYVLSFVVLCLCCRYESGASSLFNPILCWVLLIPHTLTESKCLFAWKQLFSFAKFVSSLLLHTSISIYYFLFMNESDSSTKLHNGNFKFRETLNIRVIYKLFLQLNVHRAYIVMSRSKTSVY